MRRLQLIAVAAFSLVLLPGIAAAHTAVARCELHTDTVDCEAGFHDGSDAVGEQMKVLNYAGDIIAQGTLDQRSRFQFKLPAEPFYVLFDIAPGEMFEVEWMDIVGMPASQYTIETANNP